jgi:hypothetical protein
MEQRFIVRGFTAGALGGLLAFVFARLLAEPVIESSIAYESGRRAAEDSLRRAAGLAAAAPDSELFSRDVQSNAGLGVGMIVFGLAMGGLFAVAYVLVARGMRPRVRPRALALAVATAGFVSFFLLPFLKYPANPPAIGHPDTIRARGLLHLAMVAVSVVSVLGAVLAARRLGPRLGSWNAALSAGVALVAWLAIVMAVLPPLGHLHANQAEFGRFATETPQPLRDRSGAIVYPGFPADLLFRFRMYSVMAQAILWGTIGLAFGVLAERLTAESPMRAEVAP